MIRVQTLVVVGTVTRHIRKLEQTLQMFDEQAEGFREYHLTTLATVAQEYVQPRLWNAKPTLSEGSGPGKCSCCKTGMLWGQKKLSLILTIEYAVVIEDDPADGRSEAGVATVSAMLIIQGYNKCKKSYDASDFSRHLICTAIPPCQARRHAHQQYHDDV